MHCTPDDNIVENLTRAVNKWKVEMSSKFNNLQSWFGLLMFNYIIWLDRGSWDGARKSIKQLNMVSIWVSLGSELGLVSGLAPSSDLA